MRQLYRVFLMVYFKVVFTKVVCMQVDDHKNVMNEENRWLIHWLTTHRFN